MDDFLKVVLTGMASVAALYLVLTYSKNFSSEISTGTSAYAGMVKTFQGR